MFLIKKAKIDDGGRGHGAKIKLCITLGKTPRQTAKMVNGVGKLLKVSWSFVWRKRIIYKKLVERIGNVIKNNERITIAELASMFDISYSTAFTILDKYFDMS